MVEINDPYAPAARIDDPYADLDAQHRQMSHTRPARLSGESTTATGLAGAVTRGAAPYAAGAALGGAAGALVGGVGAPVGAAAGVLATGLTDVASSAYNPVARMTGLPEMMTPKEATDWALDKFGVKRPATGTERVAEAVAGGAAGGLSGARSAAALADTAVNPTTKTIFSQLAEGPVAQGVSGALGGVGAQGAAEMGAGPLGQFAAGSVASLMPFAGRALLPSKIDASENAKKAIRAGFAIPPADATEGHIGAVSPTTLAAGEAGKTKLAQLASAKNQPLVNIYVNEDLGLAPRTVLTPQVFKQVREREGLVYQEVAIAVPEVTLAADPAFKDAVKAIGGRSEATEKLFPSTKEPPGVAALREEMLQNQYGNTESVMHYIADLRFKATKNFQVLGDAMAHRFGAAQRQAADVLEDALERSVQNAPDYYREKLGEAERYLESNTHERPRQGLPLSGPVMDMAQAQVDFWKGKLEQALNDHESNQTLVDRFREARRTMAKSYDVEAMTNVSTGDVSAIGLGRLLQQGKPLTGKLRLIADSANSFHKAFQNPAAFGGVEPLSVVDITTAAALFSAGHHVAGGSLLARPWLRAHQISPWYQKAMIGDRPPTTPLSIFTQPGVFSATSPYGGGPADAIQPPP